MTRPRLTSAEMVEDAVFLAQAGEGMRATAHRIGTTTDALEKALYRAGQHATVRVLRSRDTAPTVIAEGRRREWARTAQGQTLLTEYHRRYEHAVQQYPDPPDVTARRRLVLIQAT